MIISVDIETDGPVPHLYSMVSLGAVSVDTDEAFYYTFKPNGFVKSAYTK